MNDQTKALLLISVLLSGASGSAGFVGGRMSAPAPEVRFVQVPVTPVAPAVESAPPKPVEAKPPPKVEAKPKPQPKPEARKPRPVPARSGLPSCAVVEREYRRMTIGERMAAYARATPEQITHGKHCLGF